MVQVVETSGTPGSRDLHLGVAGAARLAGLPIHRVHRGKAVLAPVDVEHVPDEPPVRIAAEPLTRLRSLVERDLHLDLAQIVLGCSSRSFVAMPVNRRSEAGRSSVLPSMYSATAVYLDAFSIAFDFGSG